MNLKRPKVNISSAFIVRTKCKFCLSGPAYVYSCRGSSAFQDHQNYFKSVNSFKKYCDRFCDDYYFDEKVTEATSASIFGWQADFKSYTARHHKNRSTDLFGFIYKAYCNCGKSTWTYYYDKPKDPPEILNRKGRYRYPHKLED